MTGEDLGVVDLSEVTGFVEDDPGAVVRGAHPETEEDRAKMREQQIARLLEAFHQERRER